MTDRSVEMNTRDFRANLADAINDAAVRGQITYVTQRGRRVAALVPVPVAEAAEAQPTRTKAPSPEG